MKSAKDIRHALYLAACVPAVLLLLPVLFFALRTKPVFPVTELSSGWNAERGETRLENVTRSAILETPLQAGESVLLTNTLPEDIVPEAYVYVTSEYALLRAFVDGVQVYSQDEYDPGVMVPVETHEIRLPDQYAGKEFSLMFVATQNRAFSTLQPVWFGDRDDLDRMVYTRRTYGTLYGIFLTGYGLMMFLLSLYLLRHVKRNLRLLFSAMVLFLGGLSVLSFSCFFTYVFYSPLKNSVAGLCAWYLLPAAVMGLLASLRKGSARKALSFMAVLHLLWALLTFAAHSSKTRFIALAAHRTTFRILVIAEILLCAVLYALDYYNTMKKGTDFFERTDARRLPFVDIALFTGALAVSFSMIPEILFFRAFSGRNLDGLFGTGITLPMIALLFFAGCVLQCYYVFASEHLGETRRNRQLNEIAYTDPLTGHSNRAHCEVVMNELDNTGAEFCMINMDVNGLKIINDTLGHAEGDRFLKGFAQILKIFFKNADLIGRMGGDEFLVILKDTSLTEATDRMDALTVLLHKLNRGETAFKYEASYGIAHSREIVIGKKSAEVYRLADERMYEMKRIVHLRRGGNGRDE